MRSTRASAAVERLKNRSGDQHYSLARTADGLFYLLHASGNDVPDKLCEPLEMDDFVRFVDSLGPQKPQKISKLDVAFEKQLKKNKS